MDASSTHQFPRPPMAAEVEELVVKRLEAAKEDHGPTVTIEWRGESRHLPVITVPLTMVCFNPDTHRIRAQRDLEPARERALLNDPWNDDSQTYLRQLLKQKPSNPDIVDPEFIALRDELKESGQREPGIISPHGILVDGNTRAAALRELGVQDIRVGVLPGDTDRNDINNVELGLQLRRDRRREYSYINKLIAIDEQINMGRSEEDVARSFNIKPKTLKRDRWVYRQILDAVSRSKTPEGDSLRLHDFEQHQEKLRELHRDYEKLSSDPEKADALLNSRLALLVLDFPKTSLRLAADDFFTRYLRDRLPAELQPSVEGPKPKTMPGLPGVTLPAVDITTAQARQLTDRLLQSKAALTAHAGLDAHHKATAAQALEAARETFDKAVKLAGQNVQLRKGRTALPDRLSDATDYVKQAADEFAEAKAKRLLDEEALDDALLALRDELSALARQAIRGVENPGDGVSWLLSATELPNSLI